MNLGVNTFAGHCRGITWVCVKIWAFWHSSRLGAKLAMTCSSVPIIWTISWSLSTPMPCRERMQTRQEKKRGERYARMNDLKIYIFTFCQKRKTLFIWIISETRSQRESFERWTLSQEFVWHLLMEMWGCGNRSAWTHGRHETERWRKESHSINKRFGKHVNPDTSPSQGNMFEEVFPEGGWRSRHQLSFDIFTVNTKPWGCLTTD